MSAMQNIRAKIKRKLSIRENPNPNLDDNYEADDIDEETTGHLHREIEKAEAEGHPYGRPGSFLNKLIMHGNSKTEREIQEGLKRDEKARAEREAKGEK